MYSFGVATRKISLATMCKALSETPAKLYGMFPPQGHHRPGADADIVVYDHPGRSHHSAPRIWSAAPATPL